MVDIFATNEGSPKSPVSNLTKALHSRTRNDETIPGRRLFLFLDTNDHNQRGEDPINTTFVLAVFGASTFLRGLKGWKMKLLDQIARKTLETTSNIVSDIFRFFTLSKNFL